MIRDIGTKFPHTVCCGEINGDGGWRLEFYKSAEKMADVLLVGGYYDVECVPEDLVKEFTAQRGIFNEGAGTLNGMNFLLNAREKPLYGRLVDYYGGLLQQYPEHTEKFKTEDDLRKWVGENPEEAGLIRNVHYDSVLRDYAQANCHGFLAAALGADFDDKGREIKKPTMVQQVAVLGALSELDKFTYSQLKEVIFSLNIVIGMEERELRDLVFSTVLRELWEVDAEC